MAAVQNMKETGLIHHQVELNVDCVDRYLRVFPGKLKVLSAFEVTEVIDV